MHDLEVPVLIAGASLVGMTTALLLGHHGVRSLAVEYHRGTAIHPRAAQVSQRTMEVLRSVGVEALVRQRSAEQFVQDGGVVGVETLVGGVTTHFIANLNEGIRDVSPSERVFLSQNVLEPILKERAEALGATLRFATEVVSAEQDAEGVTALLRPRDGGDTVRVRARYLVAADGAHSRLRERLGLRMQGHPTFSKSVTIYFRANLAALLADKQWAVVYVNNAKLRGFFRFEKPFDSGFLVVNTLGDPARPQVDTWEHLDDQRAVELVHAALGTEAIPVSVDSVMRWNASAEVSSQMQLDRVFIAGDAAHVMPPNGGFGGNTGMQDAHNLAWKLALVLSGRAHPRLLASYEPERIPVAVLTTEQAYTRYVVRTAPELGLAGTQPVAPELNVELGYVYRSGAIVSEEGQQLGLHLSPRESHASPGTRAPHVWLERRGERVSALDLFGKSFVLLGGADSEAWCDCARAAAAQAGIELVTHRPGTGGLNDPQGLLQAAYGIDPSGCVLVRPDGFVAWRARSGERPAVEPLSDVLAQLLGWRA
jgi:2-polyprenyl-6-methoxyphenol hydroxylase-like FAD-dependent oxidoreductase